MSESMKIGKELGCLLTKDQIIFIHNYTYARLTVPLMTLNDDDPIVALIADQLEVNADDIINLIKVFYKFFPNQPYCSKQEDSNCFMDCLKSPLCDGWTNNICSNHINCKIEMQCSEHCGNTIEQK